jgi:hypothetical protein
MCISNLAFIDFRCTRAPISSLDLPSLQEELSDILSSAADLSNKLVAKVIGYRSEQHAQLDLPSFLGIFNESWSFVIKCEVICRRMIMGLRGVILGQVGFGPCLRSVCLPIVLTIACPLIGFFCPQGQIIPASIPPSTDQSVCKAC